MNERDRESDRYVSGPTRAEKRAFWGIMIGASLWLLIPVAVVAVLVWIVVHYLA